MIGSEACSHIYTMQFTFWSWVLERSLEHKKKVSADRENLLDSAIFSILSYQYVI